MITQYVKRLYHHAILCIGDMRYTHTALVLTSQHYLAKPALALALIVQVLL